jgi:hypothetical protein
MIVISGFLMLATAGCTVDYVCNYVRADGTRYQEQWRRPVFETWHTSVRVVEKDKVAVLGQCEA